MNTPPTIRRQAEQYLEHRRSLGFKLKIEGQQLLNFAEYADDSGHQGPLTVDLAVRWARLPVRASRLYQARRLEVVRCFARYLAIFDPKTEIPPTGLLGRAHHRGAPYIYSPAQIGQLLDAAMQLRPTDRLRPTTYATLFGLLACTGLRISEALQLRHEDADLHRGVLRISQTKFRKSRLVPLHPSTARVLRRYKRHRDEHASIESTASFFLGSSGRPLPYSTVRTTFRGICSRLGWVATPATRAPRIHDLRHTFAVRRLLLWYEQGFDMGHAVAALSTYMGHGKVSDTYWYLTGTPELMAVAGRSFERFAAAGAEEGGDHE